MNMIERRIFLGLCLAAACSSRTSRTPATTFQAEYDAPRDLGQLFQDVQLSGMFPDSKTFVDARPREAPGLIAVAYDSARGTSGFVMHAFVGQHFELPQSAGQDVRLDTTLTMEEHIRALWPVLTRQPDSTNAWSTLIPLPHAYVVPGGRFREVYYWDSYFTMLGLVRSGRTDLVKNMLDNFAHLIDTIGFIPNGNRTYYLGRSQPPFFAAMVGLYAQATDTAQALAYLPALEAEHAFWMDGGDRLEVGQSYRRVVRMPDGTLLNRYWDDRATPRPESFRPDYEIAQRLPADQRERFYRNARATAESGWDFSSRWMRDTLDLRTLETTELIPVDLNSLLYNLERTVAALRRFRKQSGDSIVAARFDSSAERRKQAVLTNCYDAATGYFYDYRFRTFQMVLDRPTLAAAAPLYFGLATPMQAAGVANVLANSFLKPGGFTTTLIRSGQQWDAPNGWPPLEWMAIEGLRRYGRTALADSARSRWLALNRRVYRATGKMTEKYDVFDLTKRAGGGEYPNQDGFGWTNGVALALAQGSQPQAGQGHPVDTARGRRAPRAATPAAP